MLQLEVGVIQGSVIGIYIPKIVSNTSLLVNTTEKFNTHDVGCTANGTDSSTEIVCFKQEVIPRIQANISFVACDNVSNYENIINGVSSSFGTVLIYQCNGTKELTYPKSYRVCQLNGTWTIEPECIQLKMTNCEMLLSPANGVFTSTIASGQGSDKTHTATFSCNSGYTLPGKSEKFTITCTETGSVDNRKWNNPAPVCSPINCGEPNAAQFMNGKRNGSDFTYGSQLKYSCNEGYELSGSSIIVCFSTGKWSSDPPVCLDSSLSTDSNSLLGSIISVSAFTYISTSSTMFSKTMSKLQIKYISSNGQTPSILQGFSNSMPESQTSHVHTLSHNQVSSVFQDLNTLPPTTSTTKSNMITNDRQLSSTIVSSMSLITADKVDSSGISVGVATSVSVMIFMVIILMIVIGAVMVLRKFKRHKNTKVITENRDTWPSGPTLSNQVYGINNVTSVSGVINISNQVYELSETNLQLTDQVYSLPDNKVSSTGKVVNVDHAVNKVYGLSKVDRLSNDQVYEAVNDNELEGLNIESATNTRNTANTSDVYFILSDHYATAGPISDTQIEDKIPFSYTVVRETLDALNAVYSDVSVYSEAGNVVEEDPHSYDGLNASPYEVPSECERDIFTQLKRNKIPVISNDKIKIYELLGSGEFGSVYRGIWHNEEDIDVDVAIKKLKSSATKNDTVKFLQEAAIMAQFKCTNVVRMFGVVVDEHKQQLLIVVELLIKGDLHNLLNNTRTKSHEEQSQISASMLLSFCRQVCLGMTYLSGRGFVHRDLAARNILLSSKNVCKIADFGMSRDLASDSYYVSTGGMIPIKWTAPEAISYKKYSSASDVWSFGCLMYEIWSVGIKPFANYSNMETIEIIEKGYRLPPPPGCPKSVYKTMIQCWHSEPKDRPSFHDVMLVLLEEDEDVFYIPQEDLSTHPDAGTLGADPIAGEKMYQTLQNTYKK